MSDLTVADYLLDRLRAWGVRQVFAYPGDGINAILAAWGRADNHPRFIQSRHEEMSAFQAVGYAKFSGGFGVCMATSGPGAVHLLNGLYDAKLDHVPVVAIVGQTNRSTMGGSYQQELDLLSLYKDVTSEYVQMVTVAEQLPNVLDRAIRIAVAERAPTALIIPADVQELAYEPPTHDFKMVPSSLGVAWPQATPDEGAIRRAAQLLNAGWDWRVLAALMRVCLSTVWWVRPLAVQPRPHLGHDFTNHIPARRGQSLTLATCRIVGEQSPAGSGPAAGRGATHETQPAPAGDAAGDETSTPHHHPVDQTGTASPQGEAA